MKERALRFFARTGRFPCELIKADTITDGFGNYWPAKCAKCGAPMQVLRPGDARCSDECYLKEG